MNVTVSTVKFCYILFSSEVGQVLLPLKKREDFLISFFMSIYL